MKITQRLVVSACPSRRAAPPDCPCRVHRATSIAHAIPTRSPAHRVTPTMHRQPSSRHAWKEVTMSYSQWRPREARRAPTPLEGGQRRRSLLRTPRRVAQRLLLERHAERCAAPAVRPAVHVEHLQRARRPRRRERRLFTPATPPCFTPESDRRRGGGCAPSNRGRAPPRWRRTSLRQPCPARRNPVTRRAPARTRCSCR